MNPWEDQTVFSEASGYLGFLRFVLPLVSVRLSSHWYNAMLGHFYCKSLHVVVCYPGVFLRT